jgi:hypothetical protein
MLVTIIATLCLADDPTSCIDRVVTEHATLMQCEGAVAMQAIPLWMEKEGYFERGYHLAKWECVRGLRI